MRDNGHEVGARPLELAESLGRLALESVERCLVDRERGLVRERADETHLLLEELLVVGDLQHHGAEEAIVVTITYDHQARKHSYELLADIFGL